jgi:hypothetical protein
MPDAKSAAKENPIHHFMMPSELVQAVPVIHK